MKRLLAILILLTVCIVNGSAKSIDSLLKKARISEGIEKAEILSQISEECHDTDLVKYARMAYQYSKNINYFKGISLGLHNLGLGYSNTNSFDSAKLYFNQALKIRTDSKEGSEKICESLNAITDVFILEGKYILADSSILKSIQIQSDTTKNIYAETLNQKGYMLFMQGMYMNSIHFYQRAYNIWKRHNNKSDACVCLNNIGTSYLELGDIEHSIDAYKQSLEANIGNDLLEVKGNSINGLSVAFLRMDDYINALKYIDSSIVLNKKSQSEIALAVNYGNKGSIYENAKDNRTAIEYSLKSLAIREKHDDIMGIPITLNNIGVYYMNLDDFENAKTYYFQSYSKALAIEDKRTLGLVLNNLATLHYKSYHLDSSLFYLNKSIKLYTEIKSKRGITNALCLMATIFIEQNQIAKAQKSGITALKLAQELGYPSLIMKASKLLAKIYSSKGSYKNAYLMQVLFSTMADSIKNDEVKAELIKNKFKYIFENKENLIKEKSKSDLLLVSVKNQRQKNIFYSLLGVILFLGVISLLAFWNFRNKKKKEKAELNALIIETDLKAFRAQMNPHFIFNSLQSIQAFLLQKESEEARKYLSKFAKLMRRVLENSEQREVYISSDIEALTLYIQLENSRFEPPYTYEFDIDKSIDSDNEKIPPLILQPFIENSIKHGFVNGKANQRILISIKKENSMFKSVVEDNGNGRNNQQPEKSLDKKESLGIKITLDRLAILHKSNHLSLAKKENEYFNIIDLKNNENQPNGTRIELLIPII